MNVFVFVCGYLICECICICECRGQRCGWGLSGTETTDSCRLPDVVLGIKLGSFGRAVYVIIIIIIVVVIATILILTGFLSVALSVLEL